MHISIKPFELSLLPFNIPSSCESALLATYPLILSGRNYGHSVAILTRICALRGIGSTPDMDSEASMLTSTFQTYERSMAEMRSCQLLIDLKAE